MGIRTEIGWLSTTGDQNWRRHAPVFTARQRFHEEIRQDRKSSVYDPGVLVHFRRRGGRCGCTGQAVFSNAPKSQFPSSRVVAGLLCFRPVAVERKGLERPPFGGTAVP